MSIPNPVPGGTFTDTFGACRGTNCSRKHMGTDIFAPRGTPILAPVAGRVVVTGPSGLGGNRVWVVGNDGRAYYFAHLDRIIATVGQVVGVGAQLGTVGNTGDAAGGATHLHFSINGKVGAENPVANPALEIDKGLKLSSPTSGSGVGTAKDPFGNPINAAPSASSASASSASSTPTPADSGGLWGKGCLIGGQDLPGPVNIPCLLNRSQGRAVVGGLLVLAGGVIMSAGVVLVVTGKLGIATPIGNVKLGSGGSSAKTSTGYTKDERESLADTRFAEHGARQSAAQNRQEKAEREMVRRRQTVTAA